MFTINPKKRNSAMELGINPSTAGDSGKGLVNDSTTDSTTGNKMKWYSLSGTWERFKKSKMYIMNDSSNEMKCWTVENVDAYIDVNLLILVNSLMLAAPASFMVGAINQPLDAMADQINTCITTNSTYESIGFTDGLSFPNQASADSFVIRQYNFLSGSLLTTMYAASVTIIWCIIYFVCKPLGSKSETRFLITGNTGRRGSQNSTAQLNDDQPMIFQTGNDLDYTKGGAPKEHQNRIKLEQDAFIEWWRRARYLVVMLYIGTLTSVVSLSIAVNVFYNDMVSPTIEYCDLYLDRYHNFLITISFALVSILLAFFIVL
jgi:hypothetical protein